MTDIAPTITVPNLNTSGALPDLPLKVRNKTLLGILMLIPLFGVTALIDGLFLNGAVKEFMYKDPQQIALWAAVLTVPHIIASLITFVDRDYVVQYRKSLIKGGIFAIILGFGVPFFLGGIGILIVMAFYTMYHNLMQQYGLSLMMCRQPATRDYHVWRWCTILPAGVAYTALMASDQPMIHENWDMIVAIIGGFLAFATIFGIRLVLTVLKNPLHTKIGLAYLLMNMLMLYVCFGLIASGYGFMATLLPRLTHDFTAFWIYMVHDQNRNAVKVHNPIYYIPKKLGIPPVLLCAPIAITITYFLMNAANTLYTVSLFITALNFMHYYMESYMWKRGTLHRQYVPFA